MDATKDGALEQCQETCVRDADPAWEPAFRPTLRDLEWKKASPESIGSQDAKVWHPLDWREITRWPLPHLDFRGRLLLRAVALAEKRLVGAIYGLDNLLTGADPIILVANHSTRHDALVLPAFLLLHRGGRLIHFLADWNFLLIPGAWLLYRHSGAIVVASKPAKPRFLNLLKPFLVDSISPIERARQHLSGGRSIGIFSEGTVNRDPKSLLAGRSGAARLSLEMSVPVVPVGLRFRETGLHGEGLGAMDIHIGPSLRPPPIETSRAPIAAVRAWHAKLMSEIALLSGKAWRPRQGGST